MKLQYERGALADLAEIFAYIAEDDRGAAARLVSRIENVAQRIAANPMLGDATRKPNYRRLAVGRYLIVYEMAKEEVIIQYVRHGARRRPWEGE
jgi:toxin ParE1/3/4